MASPSGVAALAALVLLMAHGASAGGIRAMALPKDFKGPGCMTPINQLACKLADDKSVIGLWYGQWGPNPAAWAAGRQDYLPGQAATPDSTYWYTNNYCGCWGFTGVCTVKDPTPAEVANVQPPFPSNGFANGLQRLSFVTAMRAYRKGGRVLRVEWDTVQYDLGRVAGPGNPPIVTSALVAGSAATVACGQAAGGAVSQWSAPDGMVLGRMGGTCSKGFKGAAPFLRSAGAVCATYPAPYPGAKFVVKNGVNPNNSTCPLYNTYYCPGFVAPP